MAAESYRLKRKPRREALLRTPVNLLVFVSLDYGASFIGVKNTTKHRFTCFKYENLAIYALHKTLKNRGNKVGQKPSLSKIKRHAEIRKKIPVNYVSHKELMIKTYQGHNLKNRVK